MSNSFLPKKASNVLNQETLERFLVALRQPFSIAVLASLGLHGVLWAALPNILADTEKAPDTKQRVQTVELSPAEQSQLPSFGIDQVPTLLPTKPAKPTQSGTKLPDPKLYNDPSLYNFPILPPPPNIFPADLSSLFPKTPPLPPKDTQKPAPKSPARTETTKPETKPETTKPETTKPETTKPETRAGSDSTTPAPARSDKLLPEQIAALRQDAVRSRQLRSLYAFNGPQTQDKALEVAKANLSTFQAVVAKTIGSNDYDDSRFTKNPEKVTNLFPKDACSFVGGVRNASFGAIVKPDGTLAEPPVALLPSGYKGLDDAAIEDITNTIKNKKFGESRKFQLIRFDYIFDSKSFCPKSANQA